MLAGVPKLRILLVMSVVTVKKLCSRQNLVGV